MATEFNPGGPVRRDNATRGSMNPPTTRTRNRGSWGLFAAAVVIVLLVATGLLFSMRDTDTTASSTAPGTTTGSTLSPSNPPAAAGPQGQGEGNSTR